MFSKLPNTQPQYSTTSITNTDDWVSMFNSNGGKLRNCAEASVASLSKNGVTQAWEKIQIAKENSLGTDIELSKPSKIKEGVDYINSQLSKGNYVKTGVNHELSSESDYYKGVGKDNRDGSTDHWVTITDIKYDSESEKYYYRYFENGTKDKSVGTSDDNRLYINTGGSIRGGNEVDEPGNSGDYQVMQIRKNN